MAHNVNNPMARRNLILYAGLIMLALAVFHQPSLLWFFLSIKGILQVCLWGFASLFAALAFHEQGSLLLKDNGWPWYARPGGLLLLAGFVTLFFLVGHVVNHVLFPVFGVTPFVYERTQLYEFLGMTFLWIVFLERIRCQ